jgi:arylsulfatase A-like enzyme
MDTVRAGHLGTYGYQRPTTPSLDAWAKASVVFDNAWSNSSFTRPSITGILTGRYVSQVLWATQSNRQVIAANNGTIGAVAKHSGAYSGAIISCPGYLNRRLGFQYGFDDFISPASPFQPKESSPTRTPETPELIFEWMKRPSADEQANIAIQWMEDRTGHQFFLWVHLIDTHPPYSHHIGTPEFGSDADSMADHELRFTDSQVGRILEWLEQTGVGARTAVFVTSDHGIYHGERRLPNQERYLYPEFTRVPLIVHIPGLPAGRVSIPVSHIDILPTVAQLVGVSIAIPLPGRSLLPLMSHAPDGRARRPIFQIVSDGDQQRRAVVDGCALLIHNILPESTYERYDGCRRGADLLTDEYDPVRDGNLRDLLSRLEDESQVPLPPWTP